MAYRLQNKAFMFTGRRQATGFTLVELMIALTVVGLLLVVATPFFGRFLQSWRLGSETEQLAATLRAARSAAILKHVDAVFEFDVKERTYSYFEDADQDGKKDVGEYESAVHTFPRGLGFDSHTLSVSQVTFGPKGGASEDGVITIENLLNRTKTVRITGGTGAIRVD